MKEVTSRFDYWWSYSKSSTPAFSNEGPAVDSPTATLKEDINNSRDQAACLIIQIS